MLFQIYIYSKKLSEETFVGLEDIFKTCLQHVFSVPIFHRPRGLADVLKTSRKTSGKTKYCYAEDVLETCLEEVLKTCLEDVFKTSLRQAKC